MLANVNLDATSSAGDVRPDRVVGNRGTSFHSAFAMTKDATIYGMSLFNCTA
jgi:hypothetical protein